eukprot:910083_1
MRKRLLSEDGANIPIFANGDKEKSGMSKRKFAFVLTLTIIAVVAVFSASLSNRNNPRKIHSKISEIQSKFASDQQPNKIIPSRGKIKSQFKDKQIPKFNDAALPQSKDENIAKSKHKIISKPKYNVPQPKDNDPKDNVPQPKDNVPQPKDNVPQPKDNVPQPKDNVQQPKDNVPRPNHKVPHPKDNVSQPKDNVVQPKHNVPQSKDKTVAQSEKSTTVLDDVQKNIISVYNDKIVETLETRYQSQKDERAMLKKQQLASVNGQHKNTLQHFMFQPHWPCWFGMEVMGDIAKKDGHKWTCGARFLKSPCVVYSFGSHGSFDFEISLRKANLPCEIHIFDPTSKNLGSEEKRWTYHDYGIGAKTEKIRVGQVKSLTEIMKELGHSRVDILKIDVEGSEFATFFALDEANEMPEIGQMQIEVHAKSVADEEKLIDILESNGMRIFSLELNLFTNGVCVEYALINKDWNPLSESDK